VAAYARSSLATHEGRVARVLDQHRGAELLVAGWQADSLVERGQSTPPGVRFLSNLDDHNSFFDRVGILAFPLSAGSGMKVKVLESMALGVSVVTTLAGLEGLPEQSQLACYCAHSDEEFIEALLRALKNKEERVRKAEVARALVIETCSPEIVGGRMLELYAKL
jgi:glycosyltransferase involved in cell wall biosynthesis